MSNYIIAIDTNGQPYLAHHGIKGQKWGVRRFQNPDMTWTEAGKERYGNSDTNDKRSFKGNVHRLLASNYSLNEKTYNKLGNKTLASMNAAAKNEQLEKAKIADAKAAVNREAKKEKERKAVDVSLAKNSATKRVAEDYHRLTNREFAGKYQTTKKTFAKRYQRTKGDTYTLGRKKQAAAVAFLTMAQGKGAVKAIANVAKYDAISRGEQHALDVGRERTASFIKAYGTLSAASEFLHR